MKIRKAPLCPENQDFGWEVYPTMGWCTHSLLQMCPRLLAGSWKSHFLCVNSKDKDNFYPWHKFISMIYFIQVTQFCSGCRMHVSLAHVLGMRNTTVLPCGNCNHFTTGILSRRICGLFQRTSPSFALRSFLVLHAAVLHKHFIRWKRCLKIKNLKPLRK